MGNQLFVLAKAILIEFDRFLYRLSVFLRTLLICRYPDL